MGYTITCPNCDRGINSDEHADLTKVTCPQCETVFDGTAEGQEASAAKKLLALKALKPEPKPPDLGGIKPPIPPPIEPKKG